MACENDYPILKNLTTPAILPHFKYTPLFGSQLNEKNIKEKLKEAGNFLDKYHEKSPCTQLYIADVILNEMFVFLCNGPSYGTFNRN